MAFLKQLFSAKDATNKRVKVGAQKWLAENLNVDHYRNGDPIPEVQDAEEWTKLTTGAWCYYENDPENGKVYGKLYNWYAVNDPRGLAPAGWHVPTIDEWQTLVDLLGGEDVAGGKLKEAGAAHWRSPNEGATNESGFTAWPGGWRYGYDGNFEDIGSHAVFWHGSEDYYSLAWSRRLSYRSSDMHRCYFDGQSGFSVRLLRD
ncbi:fibrobacter succinogenes major paralogous domain-containing protein [candidate division KSB1 bacterium]|nr:fibrobacter succinogenes major paralogous domain-containing protein [candidate division KSB1 bacterium]